MSVDTSRPTWEELVAHEPRLNALLDECQRRRRAGNAWWTDYEWAKAELSAIVGLDGEHPASFLGSPDAYDVAVRTISDALGL